MGFNQPTSPPASATSHPNASTSSSKKRAMFGNYLSSLGDTISEKASLTNLRQVQATYDPRQSAYTLKLQLLINSSKGVIQQTDSIARQSHRTSEALFTWAQDQSASPDGADLVDVGDRLAYLSYKTGDLFLEYGKTLEKARVELKDIRNFENDLTKGRERRKFLENQIAKMKQDSKPKADHQDRLASLSNELHSTTTELSSLESTLAQLKRSKLKNSYSIQFDAMRELGEKLAMIGGYGDLLIDELKESASSTAYDGQDRTAWIRGAAAESLAGYQGPLIKRPEMGQAPVGLGPPRESKSPTTLAVPGQQNPARDTRLFGESHRQELANLIQSSGAPHQPYASSSSTLLVNSAPSNVTTHALNSNPHPHPPGSAASSFVPSDPRTAPQLPARPNTHSAQAPRPGPDDPSSKAPLVRTSTRSPPNSDTKPLPNFSRPSSSTTSEIRTSSSVSTSHVPSGAAAQDEVLGDLPPYTLTDSGQPTVI